MGEYNLRVVIDAIADKFDGVIAKVESSLESLKDKSGAFADKLDGVSNKLGGAAKKMAPVSVAAGAVGASLIASAKATAAHTDEIDKMSQKLGMSRKAYQEWDYVLSQAGTDINSMTTGMKTMTNTIGNCAEAGSTAGTAYEKLGISWDQLAGKSREDIFAMTIQSLQGVESETERAALANELFGKSGQNLMPLLNQGVEATENLKKAAREYGFVLDDEVVDAGVNFTDAMDTMHRSLQTVSVAIGSLVMPLITKFCYFVAANIPKITKRIRELADRFNGLPTPIQAIIPTILGILTASAPVLKIASLITGKIAGIVRAASSGAGILGKVFALPPQALLIIGIIAAITAAFIHLYNTNEEFRTKMQEIWAQVVAAMTPAVEALKNAWISIQPALQTIIQTITQVLEVAIPIISQIVAAVLTAIAKILPIIAKVSAIAIQVISVIWQAVAAVINFVIERHQQMKKAIETVIAIIRGLWTVFKDFMSGLWDGIKAKAAQIWDAIKAKVKSIVDGIKAIWNGLPEPVKKVFTTIANHVSKVFTGIQNAWKKLKDFASGVANGIGNAFSKMVRKVKSIINKFIGAANAGIGVVNSLPGVSISKIPYLAHGTKDWQGGFAVMNERGGELTYLPNGSQVIPHDISMKYAREAAKANGTDDSKFYNAVASLSNAMMAGIRMQGGQGGEYHINIDLGGARVAEQIYTLNKQGELIMKGA